MHQLIPFFLFFFMRLSTPRSTLFPYTTLFRSVRIESSIVAGNESSDFSGFALDQCANVMGVVTKFEINCNGLTITGVTSPGRSEEHTSELQSHSDLVCRLLLEKKKKK